MKKQNFIFAAVLAGVVAAAGTIIAVVTKSKHKKEQIESEKAAAGVEPIKESQDAESEEEGFTLSEDEDVVADGDVVVMDTPDEDKPSETEKEESDEEKDAE